MRSTTQAAPQKLSSSFITFLDNVTTKGFHFRRQLSNGKWSSVPRCSLEHQNRLADLESTISDLQSRGK